ncbi:beta-ketoacyl synthase chain length factor [Mucilaginibacter auburnensis]|uniref:3-oxoacyl-(Acyl-carrier-protein) synthase n=1 Tax=Mucilaginibacter auburnensis TaxID=1457233 RepID=A0A2H9VMJ7_9SPHI|nr:beta-ketoacyl synthase chain length factor [Mucilaginibacter auburnensis]PJJ79558.1 3-oxoacyl-(acyl-carrier-protein) synthase [Mucilaginibacter auburnensis]
MSIYIRSAASVSAQNTLDNTQFLANPMEYTGTRVPVVDPDYKQYIDPKLIRRMSHVIKMGVAAAQQCLNNAQLQMPGAIVTGTALGCLEDTYVFLSRIIEMEEEMLPPTAFIQSTHNTVGAQVALMLKCHAYNNTFVHKGVSFENALLDAILLLKEGEANDILVGGIDELTDASYIVLERLGLYRRKPVNNLDLFRTTAKGSIGGEGASFVLLSDEASLENLARLVALKTLFKPQVQISNMINDFLDEQGLTTNEVDVVITGRNGDIRNDAVYDVIPAMFENSDIANYKHLTGEYSTASAFSMWLGANIVKRGEVPIATVQQKGKASTPPKNVLIYNHYQNIYHSLLLLSAC